MKGLEYTPAEIAQQPECWRKTVQVLNNQKEEIASFLKHCGIPGGANTRIALAGAGSSEFIGDSVEGVMRKTLKMDVDTRAATDIITSYEEIFIPAKDYVVVHFARSGYSPETVGTFNVVKKKVPGAKQIIITCNKDGELAKQSTGDDSCLLILLPEETNDKGLAMTSSYSSMAVAAMGLGFINDLDAYSKIIESVCSAGEKILENADKIYALAEKEWERGVFLGTGNLYGVARESHLKVSEMSEGQLMCRYDSFVGLRHGPQVVIKNNTFVMAFVSSNGLSYKYEMDLLKELRLQGKAGCICAVVPKANEELKSVCDVYIEILPNDGNLEDCYRAPCDVIAGQLFGMFKSHLLGLKPDSPSTDAVINRVVQGVTIYDVE